MLACGLFWKERDMDKTDVLIVGAGPTGLVLALWLQKQGIAVRIIDKTAAPGTTSRAMAVQARTLELYRQLGLAEEVALGGLKNPAINLWVKGKRKAHVEFRDAGARVSQFPFILMFPQDIHERLLIHHLESAGCAVERQTELIDFQETAQGVSARLRLPSGEEQVCDATYLAGCDGARSYVRHKLGTGFPGGTYEQIFYVADVQATGDAANGEAHLSLESSDFVALFPYGEPGQGRLIGTVKDESAERAEREGTLTFQDVSSRAIGSLGLEVQQVNWFSTYRVHHRVTESYRTGRAFLVGDAAHVHSPAGGQGMNTGIGDAINLAWKLAAVLKDMAPESLLDTYQTERLAFARKLVSTTDRVFSFMTADGDLADFARTQIVPIFARLAFGIRPVQEIMFRVVSQTTLSYPDSPLSQGEAGKVRGGDRLPWVASDGSDNHAPLSAITWQVHVYGNPADQLRAWCETRGIPLHVFPWSDAYAEAGLARDATYLLRPDTYVAVADSTGAPEALESYFGGLGFRIGKPLN
jgi:2-polyprenyl-6-methoxyphenol hydroxylase-like FAD-dependent oxidoreductase